MNNNRQISFRVWINEEKRFKYCDYIPTMGFVWRIDGTPLELGENYPQQFTGLKDKNNKEIYEGDIIKSWEYEDWGDEIGFEINRVVYFKNGRFSSFTSIPDEKRKYMGTIIDSGNVELIGNIYETLYLLKK